MYFTFLCEILFTFFKYLYLLAAPGIVWITAGQVNSLDCDIAAIPAPMHCQAVTNVDCLMSRPNQNVTGNGIFGVDRTAVIREIGFIHMVVNYPRLKPWASGVPGNRLSAGMA
jgi:hypothetical protein